MHTSLNLFNHRYSECGEKTFVLLHGTGGDENDLIPLAEEINDSYSILSLRGNVKERGMNRFFERYADMTFNIEHMKLEAQKLHMFLKEFTIAQHKSFDELVFLGYSNGANFALSFLFLYPDLIKKAVLLHPMLPFEPQNELSLNETTILITYGEHDTYASSEQMDKLKNVLEKTNADVTFYKHTGGHEIRGEEIDKASKFLDK